jgi:type IX secretion system PorP/SprF family membrane protein
MKKIIYMFCFVLLILSNSSKAQDIHFSQINESPLFNSPANTGFYNGYFRASLNYRNQWLAMGNGFGAAFNTGAVSIDGGLFKSKRRKAFLGLGFTYTYDLAGSANLNRNNALLNISGILKTSKRSVLSMGIAGGIVASNANYNKLRFASQFDGNQLEDNAAINGELNFRQYTHTDIGIGIAYEYSKVRVDEDHDDVQNIKFAFGSYHLNRPVQDFTPGSSYRLPIRNTLAITSNFDFKDTKFTISPAMVTHQQGKAWQIVGGTFVKYRVSSGTKITGQKTQNALGLGLFYRTLDAIIPKFTYDMGDLSFGLSYDVNVSGYRTASKYNGGFEISIKYNNLASSLFDSRSEFR